jgi:organic radical activating enzyme
MQIVKFYEKGYDPNTITIQWNLGNTCNYKCEYCPSILHRGDIPWVDIPMITETLIKIQKYFSNKKIYVEFLGGEITLYKDIIELLKFCKLNNFNNLIFTNGSRTFRHWNELIPYLDRVLLTYHPHTTSSDHFTSLLTLLYNNQVNFFVHIAMVKEIFYDLIDYSHYLKSQFPNKNISLTLMMDKAKNKNFNGYFYNYSEEEINIIKNQEKSSEKYIAEYANNSFDEFSLNQIKSEKLNKFKNFNCGYDFNLIIINSFGKASTSLCGQNPKINIFDDDLNKLFSETKCSLDFCVNPSDIRIPKKIDP